MTSGGYRPAQPPSAVRVALVDDSPLARRLVRDVLTRETDVEVVWEAGDGLEALGRLRTELPQRSADVLCLDLHMPVLDGLATLRRLPRLGRVPRVVMLSSATRRGARETLDALAHGAVDYVCKPASDPSARARFERELVEKIRIWGRWAPGPAGAAPPAAGAPGASRRTFADRAEPGSPPHRSGAMVPPVGGGSRLPMVVGIAASTGGPQALAVLLRGLPKPFALPVLVTQHMPPGFTAALADHLARTTGHPCAEARAGEVVRAGHVYLAPGDRHLVVASGSPLRLQLEDSPPRHFCRPAADPMFESMAEHVGGGAVAVVLTGMGRDGAEGAARIAARGGTVVAQDENTSVVWGMPGATVRAGAASHVLPLGEIPALLAKAVTR